MAGSGTRSSCAFPSLEDLSFLADSTKEKAALELNETPEVREVKIGELKAKIEEYGDEKDSLVDSRRDDAFLLRFLRAKKFDVDRAFQQYKNFYQYRQNPSIFAEYSLEKVRPLLERGMITIGNRSREGAQVISMNSAKMDFSRFTTDDIIRALAFSLDFLIESQETQVHGFVLIVNHAHISFKDVLSMGPSDAKKIVGFVQECFPARFKGIHILHQPWYITIFLTIIKTFMKKKMKERLRIHGWDYSDFHKVVAPDNLPQSVGGELPEADPGVWLKYLSEKCKESSVE
eukprot:m.134534 g.134534  ORF g.134534 m.134534 type:complete len:289 (+) comp38143_c0_seq1:11-877(+)